MKMFKIIGLSLLIILLNLSASAQKSYAIDLKHCYITGSCYTEWNKIGGIKETKKENVEIAMQVENLVCKELKGSLLGIAKNALYNNCAVIGASGNQNNIAGIYYNTDSISNITNEAKKKAILIYIFAHEMVHIYTMDYSKHFDTTSLQSHQREIRADSIAGRVLGYLKVNFKEIKDIANILSANFSYTHPERQERYFAILKGYSEVLESFYGHGNFRYTNFNGMYLRNISVITTSAAIYLGESNYEERNGYGTLYYANSDVYKICGTWKDNLLNGKATVFYSDGRILQIQYSNNQLTGNGLMFKYNKGGEKSIIFDGYYQENKRNGFGREYQSNVLTYEGSFVNDMYEGKGTQYDIMKNKKYMGDWKEGKANGLGTEFYSNSKIKYKGYFTDGTYNGIGMLFLERKQYYGEFVNGKLNGTGTLIIKKLGVFYRIQTGIWKNGVLIEKL